MDNDVFEGEDTPTADGAHVQSTADDDHSDSEEDDDEEDDEDDDDDDDEDTLVGSEHQLAVDAYAAMDDGDVTSASNPAARAGAG